MNTTDMAPLTTLNASTQAAASQAPAVDPSTMLPTQANTTIFQVVTTVAPSSPDSGVVAVVIILILLTIAVLGFLLYRYLCHNKGDYRTTGEPAPGHDLEDDDSNQGAATEKKEYFI